MKFRITAVVILLFLSALLSLMIYDLKKMDPETIILCASNEGGILIPGKLCEYFIYNQRDIKKDIQELSNGAGLAFILNGKSKLKYKLAKFYISRGLNINSINHYGNYNITSLHAAVLFNDIEMTNFLIKHGANQVIKPPSINMTPLEFALSLKKKEPNIDRNRIIETLRESFKKS